MSKSILILFAAFLALVTQYTHAYGQKGFVDSAEVPENVENVQANNIYFEAITAKQHEDDQKAVELFEKFLDMEPKVSAAYYELSGLYCNQKKIDKGEDAIKKAIDLDNDNKWYKEQYASILAMQRKYGEAGKVMGDLSDQYPDDKGFLGSAVDYYEQANKLTEAVKYINKAIDRSWNDEDWLMQKVQILVSLKQNDEAVVVLKELISKDKQNGRYYKILGEIYDKNDQPQKAAELYDNAEKIIPGDPTLQLGMAEHYLITGDTATYKKYICKAVVNKDLDVETQLDLLEAYMQTMPNDSVIIINCAPLITEILAQHPDDPAVLATYGDFMYRDNKKQQAEEAFKKSLAIAPSNFNLWARFLSTLTDRDDADTLVRYSLKAIKLFPNQALAHYYNGIGHYYKKEYGGAINSIKRAVDLQPERDSTRMGDMYGLLGDIYSANKDYVNSEKAYEHAVHFNPDDPTILNNYSYFLSERNIKLEEAESMSLRSLKLRPNEASYMDTYGWIAYKQGDYNKARQYVEKAIELSGSNADATLFDHLGNIYYKLNDKEKAVEYWKRSKEMGGDDPQLDKKISEEKLYE